MLGLEDFMKSFGFTQETFIIAMLCMVVLLGNFAGGMFSNIILAFGGPIHERGLTQRTSFRLALVSELVLIVYAVYYHAVLVGEIEMGQVIYWIFNLVAAPLLAALGAELTYMAFASKLEELKEEGENLDNPRDPEAPQEDIVDEEEGT